MKGWYWRPWATSLCLFVIGVVFDVALLRVVGGIGTIVFLCLMIGAEEYN